MTRAAHTLAFDDAPASRRPLDQAPAITRAAGRVARVSAKASHADTHARSAPKTTSNLDAAIAQINARVSHADTHAEVRAYVEPRRAIAQINARVSHADTPAEVRA